MSRRKGAKKLTPETLILLRTVEPLLIASGQTKPPVDPWRIADTLRVPVHDEITPGIDGYVRFAGDDATIVINRKATWVRRRFTLAHEIGHVLISRSAQERGGRLPTLVRFRDRMPSKNSPTDVREERLCNRFAANLLMPTADFRSFWNAYPLTPNSIEQCASYFDVSLPAAAIRTSQLLRQKLHVSYWDARPWRRRKWQTGMRLPADFKARLEKHVEKLFSTRFSKANRSLPSILSGGGLIATAQQLGTRSMLITVTKGSLRHQSVHDLDQPVDKKVSHDWSECSATPMQQQSLPGFDQLVGAL